MTDDRRMTPRAVDCHGDQDQGERPYQEDSWYEDTLGDDASARLLVVADGMGGEAGGAEASRIALAQFVEAVRAGFSEGDDDREVLGKALEAANAELDRTLEDHPELDGFGCTLLGAILRPEDGLFHWVSVGDSPLWLIRDGVVHRLNEDHSMGPVLDELVEIGRMSAEEARHDPRRNHLRAAVTGDEIAKCDLPAEPLTLADGDVLLLASDGLDTLGQDQLAAIPATAGAEATVAFLLDAVKAAGRPEQDNVTVVAARYHDPQNPRGRQPHNESRRGWRRWFGGGSRGARASAGIQIQRGGPS
jgi:protein phosphatase